MRHYNTRGSKVYGAFSDASKDFDKVLLNGLIKKLIKRNFSIPLYVFLYVFYICGLIIDIPQLFGNPC